MISFGNTKVAFISKSDKELRKSIFLFKLISNNFIVKIGEYLSVISVKLGLPVKSLIKKTIYTFFVGGETIEDCTNTIDQLNKYNIGSILDYSVEGKEDEKSFNNSLEQLIKVINYSKENIKIPFTVFKVSGLCSLNILEKHNGIIENLNESEKTKFESSFIKIDKLCKTAFDNDVKILIDAEESWIQNAINNITEQMMQKYNQKKTIVYTTTQHYRTDSLEYLKSLHIHSQKNNYKIGVKLVRGAYMEKERERAKKMNYQSPINETKKDTDNQYDEAIEYCIMNSNEIEFIAATHNEQSSQYLVELMEKKNMKNNDENIYFAQLLGMSDHISYNLSINGYNVAKYVPFGPVLDVLPYLIRRTIENTSIKGQTNRELELRKYELDRRNSSKD